MLQFAWVYQNNWKRVHGCYFSASGYRCSLITGIPAVYCVLSNYSQVGAGQLEVFCKENERLEAFCGHGLGKNGVCNRHVTLYFQFYVSES